jgi:NAD(P)-dependent dehydrogenase (short-subunit alcohol dehydrogenase family)
MQIRRIAQANNGLCSNQCDIVRRAVAATNEVCADINDKGADETAAEVNRKGSKALAIKVDVTKRAGVDDMAGRAIAAFGRVQFLFNSAGAAIHRAKISRDR